MTVCYDEEKLREIIYDLHNITGLSIAFMNDKRKFICRDLCDEDNYCRAIQSSDGGSQRCRCSDADIAKRCIDEGTAAMHTCHDGLADVAVPITKDEICVGFVFFGRVRIGEMTEEQRQRLGWLGDRAKGVIELYDKIKKYTWEQLESLSRLVSNILFDNVIEIKHDSLIEALDSYIEANISKRITLNSLLRALYVSKNRLYSEVKDAYGITVNEYVLHKKLKRAKKLLAETKIPTSRVSAMVGIPNHTYFFKLFKRKCSLTPSEYRNREQKSYESSDTGA